MFPAMSTAHDKVVVIPFPTRGHDKPLEPFAPLTAPSPVDSDYELFTTLGTVTDYITGLEWQKDAGSNAQNWDDAWNSCRLLNLYGYGWRLPSVSELMSIVDYGSSWVAINNAAFPGIWQDQYWSATTLSSFSFLAWRVGFTYGHVDTASKTAHHLTRCVRSSRPTGPVFQDNNDSTVTDLATGLTWQQGDDSNGRTFPEAHSYCANNLNNLRLGNKSDWRLPNIKELASIVDYRERLPAIDEVMSTVAANSSYWSDTRYQPEYGKAWRVNIGAGNVDPVNWTNYHQVRCVR